jgi:DNA-binding FrmR family transcriptional regulator
MADETISHEVLVKRLRRIEGQVRGIQKMIESGRNCENRRL